MSAEDPSKKSKYEVENKEIDLESLSSSEQESHIFKDPVVAQYYRELYERTKYECRHHFDPDFTWTKQEERKVVWKNDWYVTFWAFLMFTALDFDRGNINQALSDNMLGDLGLTTNQYNLGQTINLVCFLSAELPSQLISKKIGADVWIPTQLVLWSIVSITQSAIQGAKGFYATRALIGALQGGFICDVCLWFSYFFTSKELPARISFFYIANPLTVVWSSLLAFALLRIKTHALPEGWRWLFIVEGVFTLLIGIASYFKMPASPVQTKSWFRKNGWYSDREEKIVVNRVLRDDPTKGDMNNREPVSPKELIKTLLDYDLLPIYITRFLSDIGTAPISAYLQLVLRKMGFSTFHTNALTIPYNILAMSTMLFIGWFSEVVNSRAIAIALNPIWVLACVIPLRYWPKAQIDIWGTYALLTMALAHPTGGPLSISWASSNSNSVRTRAVSAAVVNMFSQSAAIVSSNIYRKDDAPLYHRGNKVLIGVAVGSFFSVTLTGLYYQWRNAQKEKQWLALTQEEQENYLKTTTHEGNKRLDFRFVS